MSEWLLQFPVLAICWLVLEYFTTIQAKDSILLVFFISLNLLYGYSVQGCQVKLYPVEFVYIVKLFGWYLFDWVILFFRQIIHKYLLICCSKRIIVIEVFIKIVLEFDVTAFLCYDEQSVVQLYTIHSAHFTRKHLQYWLLPRVFPLLKIDRSHWSSQFCRLRSWHAPNSL